MIDRIAVGMIVGVGLWCAVAGVARGRWTWVLIGLGFCGAALTLYLSRIRPIPTTRTHTPAQVRRSHGWHVLGFALSLAAIFGGVALASMQIG
jgi:hypothetical protein